MIGNLYMYISNIQNRTISIILLLLSAMISISAYGQEDKLLYEISRQGPAKSFSVRFQHIDHLSFYPDTLPQWFFNPPLSGGDDFYAIGISDPDMTKDSAMVQALQRAKGILALEVDTRVQYFRDIYKVEKVSGKYVTEGQKYDTYYRIASSTPFADSEMAVLDSHFTRFNEQMVLVHYSLPSTYTDSCELEAKATVVNLEFTINDVSELQEEYTIYFFQDCPDTARNTETSYNYRLRDWRFNYWSKMKSMYHSYPSYSYIYVGLDAYDSSVVFTSYPGLWAGYFRGWMQELTYHAEQGKKMVRSLGDSYDPQSENIIRESSQCRGSFGFQGARLDGDKIQINLLFLDSFDVDIRNTSSINNTKKRPES